MNQVFKYIKFTIFTVLITILIGTIRVDAKTCVYDYDMKQNNITDLQTTIHIHAEYQILDRSPGIINFNKENSYTQVFDVIDGRTFPGKKFNTVSSDGSFARDTNAEGKCPTLYLYSFGIYSEGKDKGGYNIKFYANKKDCRNFIFPCNEKKLYSVEGKLEYDEDDKKECTPEEKESAADDFANGIAIYADNIQKSVDNYKIRILGAITATGRSDKSIETEVENIISGYKSYTSQAGDGILKLATNKKYECLTEAAIKSELDYITKIANEGLSDINEYKNSVFSEEIQKRQANGEDVSGLESVMQNTTDYIDNVKNQLQELIEKYKTKASELKLSGFDTIVPQNCQDTLGNVVSIVQEIFNWIKIIVPVLLILFGSMDYAKAVISNDNDILKKATNNFIKRAIAAIAIFFLPYLVNLLLNLPGIKEEINMGDDPLCTINKVVIK